MAQTVGLKGWGLLALCWGCLVISLSCQYKHLWRMETFVTTTDQKRHCYLARLPVPCSDSEGTAVSWVWTRKCHIKREKWVNE